jgi:hypothetical protein
MIRLDISYDSENFGLLTYNLKYLIKIALFNIDFHNINT